MRTKVREGMVETPSLGGKIANVAIYAFLGLVIFVCVIPLWHVLMASVSDAKALLAHEGVLWLPAGSFNLQGFRLLFKDASILMGYANTLIYVSGATIFGMFVNITGGYVLSRQSDVR